MMIAPQDELFQERTLDKKFKIRKEAMGGLAMIYYKHLTNPNNVPQATLNAVKWIKDKILHGYYMPGIEDRLLVERLLNTRLVPYNMDTEERMEKLFLLFSPIDEFVFMGLVVRSCHFDVTACAEARRRASRAGWINDHCLDTQKDKSFLRKVLPQFWDW